MGCARALQVLKVQRGLRGIGRGLEAVFTVVDGVEEGSGVLLAEGSGVEASVEDSCWSIMAVIAVRFLRFSGPCGFSLCSAVLESNVPPRRGDKRCIVEFCCRCGIAESGVERGR